MRRRQPYQRKREPHNEVNVAHAHVRKPLPGEPIVTVQLTGPRAGQTIILGRKYPFVDGKLDLPGTMQSLKGMLGYLQRCYGAVPVSGGEESNDGKRDLPTAETVIGGGAQVERPVQSVGGGTPPRADDAGTGAAAGPTADQAKLVGAGGDGHAGSGGSSPSVPTTEQVIAQAVRNLDAAVETNWTPKGLPSVAAVQAVLGDNVKVTRQLLDAAAAGWTREDARAAAKAGG